MKKPDEKTTMPEQDADATVVMEGLAPRPSVKTGDHLLGRYRVVSKLGQGAMAAVYLCHDEVGGIEVAVKTVPDEFSFDHGEMSTIQENFRLVEKLHHPNIANVKTLEKDEETGRYFLILEYVPGVDGRRYRMQRGGRLTLDQILPLARRIAAGLDYGHAEKIVHRDVKPANIMITEAGKVKILDYGIASQFQESASRLTGQSFLITGTGVYMAPEQWQGRAQDGRTDQYALAATLYEFYAGHPPFEIADLAMLREAVIREKPVAPEGMRPKVWSVLARALAKKRGDRFPTCTAFTEALAQAAQGSGRKPFVRIRFAAGIVALAVLAVGLIAGVPRLMQKGATPAGEQPRPAAGPPMLTESAQAILPRFRALVIGINDYGKRAGDGWNPLRSARTDAEAIADLLEEPYGFEVRRLFDGEATRAAIIAGLDAVANGWKDDAVVVYFAGHGFYDEEKAEGYWIPSNARQRSGSRLPTEDWVWNSTITKILDSSRARHVLLMADSCFGGSLFRGAEDDAASRDLYWYRRAITTPSRYLIASGSLEPVIDGGGRHSVFAQQVLNYMTYADRKIFSASELGLAIRDDISTLTGQLVAMGPLAMASHVGGEFVFLKDGTGMEGDPIARMLNARPLRGDEPRVLAHTVGEPLEEGALPLPSALDVVQLQQLGATNSARRILSSLMPEQGEDQLVQALTAYLDESRRVKKMEELQQLIQLLSKGNQDDGKNPYIDFAQPRILACVGVQDFRPRRGDGLEQLARICLEAEMGDSDRVYLVEREGLEHILSELNLGAADLSDARVQLEIGKLLPASVLLFGKILPALQGGRINLRAVDTETSRVLFSRTMSAADEGEMAEVCGILAGEVVSLLLDKKPLTARLWREDDQTMAGVGSFHGASAETSFVLLKRTARKSGAVEDYVEEEIGVARIAELGEMSSILSLDPAAPESVDLSDNLWVRELPL